MNFGLSDNLESYFSFTKNKINPVDRPLILSNKIPDPNWLSGFTTAEGNFDVTFRKSSNPNLKKYVALRFRCYQHERDKNLMEVLIKYLGAGKIESHSTNPVVNLTIVKSSDIFKIIIPFFETNPLKGTKQTDFLDWCKIAKLIQEGSHLTNEGLEKIDKIKAGMNRGRISIDL